MKDESLKINFMNEKVFHFTVKVFLKSCINNTTVLNISKMCRITKESNLNKERVLNKIFRIWK